VSNQPTGDKPKTKIDRIEVLSYGWSPWPHWFSYLMLHYKVSHSFWVTLMYLWKHTVGRETDSCGELAFTQIPARRKHVEKWLAALCESGFFEVDKARRGDQVGSLYTYDESKTTEHWKKLIDILARIELLGGLDDGVPFSQFGAMVARNFRGSKKLPVPANDERVQIDAATKRKIAAIEAAMKEGTRRKRS
jgi:hypothetical protein